MSKKTKKIKKNQSVSKVQSQNIKKEVPGNATKKIDKNVKTPFYYRPALIGMIGFFLQFVIGVVAYYENILIVPYENTAWIAGIVFILVGFIISYLYQKKQEELNDDVMDTVYADDVNALLTSGVYGVIRHPGYLGTMMMQLGMAFASRSYLSIIFAILMIAFWVTLAIKEEQLLGQKFGDEYGEYKEDVRWRFIPGLF